MTRTFTAKTAVREQVPIIVGICGPSGGGKTFSALRLATGMQRVVGGEIFFIDTETRRGLHYADQFKFQHMDFGAPFASGDYLDALQVCVSAGAKTIVVDSMSHEHEGPGGMLEAHEVELTRMAGSDYSKRERVSMLAWQKPKQARRKLINSMVQLGVNLIICYRAGEKSKPGKDPQSGKAIVIPQGFTPIGGSEFVYESTMSCLLMPGSKGIPTWESQYPGEKIAMKCPGQFESMLKAGAQLDEALGEKLAQWAKGGAKPDAKALAIAAGRAAAELGSIALAEWWAQYEAPEKAKARAALESTYNELLASITKPEGNE